MFNANSVPYFTFGTKEDIYLESFKINYSFTEVP